MNAAQSSDADLSLRPAGTVMRLARLGSSFPTRLSFMRVLIRQLSAEKAVVTRPVWDIDDKGYGRAVYSVPLGGFTYSLVGFSNALDAAERTDRVIAQAWDTTYVLFDGTPTPADLDRLAATAPKQEAGRFSARELVLCRANKSVRMFEHVVEKLACGEQPSHDMVASVGYLMRTTAVYGNGKFGISDRALIADRPALSRPFAAEMLAVWLVRGFTHDLVEHVARCRNGDTFVPLAPTLRRHLGIGNATGLGMAPFLVSHPVLLNNWVHARETARARIMAQDGATRDQAACIVRLIARVKRHLTQWNVPDKTQAAKIRTLRREWDEIAAQVTPALLAGPAVWENLSALADRQSIECQELMFSLLLEPNGALIDDLADTMSSDTRGPFDPGVSLDWMRAAVKKHCQWALDVDFAHKDQQQVFWYVSEEKLEPRLGDRYAEHGADKETPLDVARRLQAFSRDIDASTVSSLAEFLLEFPTHRYVARRVQILAHYPYSELHDNLIAASCLPIDMLRCKLAFFGASKFDPKSDRWTRITLYQGAPVFADISAVNADDWWLPVLKAAP